MLRLCAALGAVCLMTGAAMGQAPIAPPSSPAESDLRGGREASARPTELAGSWIADSSGEDLRFDGAGAFDGSTLGAGHYELNQGRLTLFKHGQVVCAYRAFSVVTPDSDLLRLQLDHTSNARCPSGIFTSEHRPHRADTAVDATALPSTTLPSVPPATAGSGHAGLDVTHVTARPKAGRLVGNVAFSAISPAGRIRIEVPFTGAKSRDAAVLQARKSLEVALGIGTGETR